MPQGDPKSGELYLHFKQKMYQIVTVAYHSETQEPLVIYQALYGDYRTYAIPLALFISPVDRKKYPQALQRYRFQMVETEKAAHEFQIQETQNHWIPQSPSRETSPPERMPREAVQQEIEIVSQKSTKDAEQEATNKLMSFFDADEMEEKYNILISMRECITDRMINNMAVTLDVVVEEGPLDQRYDELKQCVQTFQRYESTRLR